MSKMEDNHKKTVKEAAMDANSEQLDMIDVTVLSTPRPTASSTVARKPFLGGQYLNDSPDDNCKRVLLNETIDRKNINDSSLGILDNISSLLSDSGTTESSKIKNNIDTERQLARKLLERCSERQTSNSTTPANSVNVSSIQNRATDNTPSTLIDSVHQTLFGSSQSNATVSTLPAATSSASNINIIFEPAEITARSSGMSNSQEKSVPSNSIASSAGFSFNSGAAELMAKFENEDFLSGSQAGSRMLADEISFQQNCSYALPRTNNNEEERLELSCFSGIIGDLDLSLESCAGRKVSIGEFFKRKCEKMGQLSEVESMERPSFGATITSPKRLGNRMPLVDITLQTETSSVYKSDSPKPTLNSSEAQKKHSLMSLSTIAQALKDIDDATPRRLVDELLMAKKKKNKCSENKLNKPEIIQSATYTLLPSTRQSMPATPTIQNEKLEKTSPSFNEPERFSLDSRVTGDDVIPHEIVPSKISFSSHLDYDSHVTSQLPEAISENKKHMKQSVADQNIVVKSNPEPIKEDNMPVRSSSLQLESLLQGSYLENLSREKKAVSTLERKESKDNRAGKIVDAEGRIKEQESSVSDVKLELSTISQQQSFKFQAKSNKDAVTVKNTELCNCIVGVPGETELELSNKGDRWIMCTFSLNEIDGIKDKIELRLPSEKILIEPNARRTVKVKVKVSQMDKSFTVPMYLRISDMVTHSSWSIRHTMCFAPEEPHLTVLTHSGNKELNFQLVAENSQKSLPVTVENKNNVDLPVKLYISQDGPKLFSIDNSLNETLISENESGDIKCLTLASRQQYTTNILFRGTALTSFDSSTSEKGLHHIVAHFVVEVHTGNGNGQVLEKLPLIGYIGTCKIESIDTTVPIIIPRKESKPLNLINSGTVPVLLKATVVQSDNTQNLNSDFRVTPDNLFIHIGERAVFMITHKPSTDTSDRYAVVKVLAGSDVYFYPVVGEEISKSEQANDNLLRSETPQHLDAMGSPSSPHSPHSVALNRSRNSGRNSPSSSVSSIPVSGSVIPIRATHAALVWGSVKAGKSDTKELTIRNMSDNKIKLQAIIVDNEKNFKFLKERQTTGSSMILALQRMESRTLSIIFGPTNSGACAGKITFRHYEARKNSGNSCPSKFIHLYGYGGFGKVEVLEAFKDVSGQMWLSMGRFGSEGTLNAKIKLQNFGDLRSYVKLKLVPKAVYPGIVSSWKVNRTEFLLDPGETQWVSLQFNPKKEDFLQLHRAAVSHVGTLVLTHGDEPTRWRIRRLYKKLHEKGDLNREENESFRDVVYPICKEFPGETLLEDLTILRDSAQNLKDLCCGVLQHNIMLTMELSADETLSILEDNPDDSQMYYSLCDESNYSFAAAGDSYMPPDIMNKSLCGEHGRSYGKEFTVSPSMVTLAPPYTTEATVTVSSFANVALPFETTISNGEYFSVIPSEGMIPTGKSIPLNIRCKKAVGQVIEAVLSVYIENDKREVSIKVTNRH